MLKTYTLKNGIKVATYAIPEMKSVSLSLSVKAGSIFDTLEKSGAAHYMEHILVQGIPSFPTVEELSDYVENIAGGYNAFTSLKEIGFTFNAPAKHLKDGLKIGGEAFFSPLFAEKDIERERNAILEEIRQYEDETGFKNGIYFRDVRYKKDNPLKRLSGGTVEAVQKLQKVDLVNYWERFFYPKNAYLVVVGGFQNGDAQKIIEETFKNYNNEKEFVGFPELDNTFLSSRQVAIRSDKKLKTCYIDISFGSAPEDCSIKEVIIHQLAKGILAGMRGSRLNRLLRQQKGLVYGIGAGSHSHTKLGTTGISTEAIADNLDEVLSLIAIELTNFYKSGPTQKEVDNIKNFHINRMLMQFDHPGAIASWIKGDLLWEDQIYLPDQYVSIVQEIELSDLNEFMHKYWDFDKLNVVIQGPIANSKDNKDKFAKIFEDLK